MSFFEDTDDQKEYKYRCLVYPNVTFSKDFDKDSYCIIMGNILKNLVVLRDDIHFTCLLPEKHKSFILPNTDIVLYEQPSFPNAMRCHFDVKRIMEILDWKKQDWDFVYSFLPEHVCNLKNIFYNTTNCRPSFFGYSCYQEFPETTGYEMTMLKQHFLGILEMEMCGVNSEPVKTAIVNSASNYFKQPIVEQLKSILYPLHRGWDLVKTEKKKPDEDIKIIVFNHRANSYKSYDWFLKQMDILWETRKDFKVWVPLAETVDREYIYIDKFDRNGYFTELSRCWVGVCGKSYHKGWANSASDGMAIGTPYLYLDEDYYREYAEEAGVYFKTDDEFNKLINQILDDKSFRNKYSKKSLELYKKNTWPEIVKQYNEAFIKSASNFKMVSDKSESYTKIVEYIKKEKYVSKQNLLKHLNWGVGIPFARYRNKLRLEPNIKLTKFGYKYE